nr:40S ribosomal protein S24 [Cryptomonas curvata]
MKSTKFKIITQKFKENLLLKRKQFSLTIYHPGFASISKKELQKQISIAYKIKDCSRIFLFGFKIHFGGGMSTGFGFIYNDLDSARKFEPKYRLIRNGLLEISRISSKQRKEQKNKAKKNRNKKNKKVES